MITEDMITEDYVSYETAKLLKEKGFDILGYASIKVFGGNTYEVNEEWITPTEDVIIPTLQMAMKWLRKMHNLHIVAPITYQYLPRKYEAHIMHTEKHEDIVVNPGTNFNTNEEACEAAIKYCLEKLI